MLKSWYIISINGRLYVLFRYWKKVVDNYDTRSIRLEDRLRSIFLLSKYPQLRAVGIFIYSNNSKLLINSFLDSYNNSVLPESTSYVYC